MTDKLHFSLVSPARELFAGEVDHVIAPGTDGEFGVLPNHAPFMTTLKTGRVRIIEGDTIQRYFVRGGFADVTPEGFTVLAEEAVALEDLDAGDIAQQLQDAREDLADAGDNEGLRNLRLATIARLEAMQEALDAVD